jgi:hypothetical protein
MKGTRTFHFDVAVVVDDCNFGLGVDQDHLNRSYHHRVYIFHCPVVEIVHCCNWT